jgi:ankyrin repeat protein
LINEIKRKNLENALKLKLLGSDINAQNSLGDSAALVASKMLDVATVKALIAAGTEKNAQNLQGETVLFAFAKVGDFASVLELTDAGVDPKIANIAGVTVLDMENTTGETLLLTAAKTSTVENVLRLARIGANINKKDIAGETAIYSIIRSKSVEGLKAMINAGAHVQTESRTRVTPMDLVKSIGFKDAKKIIRNARKDDKRIDVAQE